MKVLGLLNRKKKEKVILQYSNETPVASPQIRHGKDRPRGSMVYSYSQLQEMTGRDKSGRLVSWGVEQPYFHLTVMQRVEMFRLCSPVFGIVSSRMNRLSGLKYNITSEDKKEEEIASQLRDMKDLYTEYKSSMDMSHLVMKLKLVSQIRQFLPDVLDDLSNFNASLLRWKKRLERRSTMECDDATDWLQEPNNGVEWHDFVKKYVFDQLIHGAVSVYKKPNDEGKLENFDILPGGSVYKIRSPYFSGVNGYIQVTPDYSEPQIYFGDELAYEEYLPISSRNYPMIPLEALIHKVAESLLFDKLMADQADGTKPPEKLIIVTDASPFGSLDSSEKTEIPLDEDEQKRIEQKVNEPVKNSIMTMSGNHAEIIDLSRENTMSFQNERQKDIREDVALVFNTSNLEANLTGSDSTSGRATAEVQAEIDQGRGVGPQALSLVRFINRKILPYRYGHGLIFEFELGKDEEQEKRIDQLMLQTGEMTKNEIREKYGKQTFDDPQYDLPDGSQGPPSGDQMNPFFTRNVE